MVLDLDLNNPPPVENIFLMSNWDQAPDLGLSLRLPTIDIQHDDDDEVVICSPRSFAEAREKKSRRNRELIEVLDETESLRARTARLSSSGNRRRRVSSTQITGIGDLSINLERNETTVNGNTAVPQKLPTPVPQPRAPTFRCPVCIGSFVEEMSTKCGHIFCKRCISEAIQAQSKCPSCRRKLKAKDIFRVYLPTSE